MNDNGVSVVIPVYKSEATLAPLLDRLLPVLESLDCEHEVILVVDGSPDGSWEVILKLTSIYPHVRGLRLSRNFGQHNALLCGIRSANYNRVITIDDDLQHPPEAIPTLLSKLDEGHDLVYAPPEREQHGRVRDLSSILVKRSMQVALGVKDASNITAFRAFRTSLRTAFASYQSPHVNLDVLLSWATTSVASVPVKHSARHAGKSTYTFRKLLRHTANMVFGYSTAPLRLTNFLGFGIMAFGVVLFIVVMIRYLIEGSTVPGFPFLASMMAIFSGVQLLSLGVIGEYIARIYTRTLGRPVYVIAERADTQEIWKEDSVEQFT